MPADLSPTLPASDAARSDATVSRPIALASPPSTGELPIVGDLARGSRP